MRNHKKVLYAQYPQFSFKEFSSLLSMAHQAIESQIVCEQTFIAASLVVTVIICFWLPKPVCFKPLCFYFLAFSRLLSYLFSSSYLPVSFILFLYCFALFPPHSGHPSCFRLMTQFPLSRWFHFLLLII